MADEENKNPEATENETPAEEGVSEDDWAAAMSEQGEQEAAGGGAADDWAAAMAEQETHDANANAEGIFGGGATAKPAEIFPQLGAGGAGSMSQDMDMILDIPVHLTVELGRTKITIRNLLQLAHGSVVELDAMAGEPLNVLVNGTLIAQGEVVVVNEKFGIRLTDILNPSERMRKLG